ncbi:MAG: carboxypeptidase-like regulatory domain-containing protein, partial [Bryobacteraceae bacterium]
SRSQRPTTRSKNVKRRWLLAVLVVAITSASLLAQKKKGEEDNFRMVQGNVTDVLDNAVQGAVVQLKNSKTLQVRSFITQDQGTYRFQALDPNVDYTLKAEFQGAASQVRTLSSFDSRKQPVINLKLEAKK